MFRLSTRRTINTSDYQHVGLWTRRTMNTSDYRHVGLSTRQTIDTSDCRHVGLWTRRTINTSDYRHVGLSTRQTVPGLSVLGQMIRCCCFFIRNFQSEDWRIRPSTCFSFTVYFWNYRRNVGLWLFPPTATLPIIIIIICQTIIIIIILGTYMRPISGEPEVLTNTQAKKTDPK